MYSIKTLAVSLLALASSALASPVAAGTSSTAVAHQYEGWRVVETIPAADGMLVSYEPTTPSLVPAKRQCGSNTVGCDGGNVPSAAACNSLISFLNNNANNRLGGNIRSFCFTAGTDGDCCASWNQNVNSGVLLGNLVPAATAVRNQCVNFGNSGFANNVNLQGVCLKQCLSNRPTGC